jgi:hypothetical protein
VGGAVERDQRESLRSVTNVMAELPLQSADNTEVSKVSAADLRTVGRRLVSSGGDLTRLGVEMGVAADQLERD